MFGVCLSLFSFFGSLVFCFQWRCFPLVIDSHSSSLYPILLTSHCATIVFHCIKDKSTALYPILFALVYTLFSGP